MVKGSGEFIFYEGKTSSGGRSRTDHGDICGTGLSEPETMESEKHLVGLRRRSMDEVGRGVLFSRHWCVRSSVLRRWKSSA